MNVRTVIATLLVAASVLVVPPQALAGAADEGSFFVSGQLGLNYYLKSSSPEDSPSSGLDLNIAPRVLYFPAKSIGVGGEANLNMYMNSYDETSLAIGPRVAYYVKPDASHYPRGCCLTPWFGGNSSYWMPFFGVSLLYLMDRTSYTGGSTTNTGYRGRVGVGAAPLIGDHGTAFLEVGFQTQSLRSQTSNKIYLEAGFGAFLFKH
jgi:hypothetical protein